MATRSVRYEPRYRPEAADYRLLGMATKNPLEDSMQAIERIGAATGAMAGQMQGEADVFGGEQPEFKLPLSPAAVAYNRAIEEAYGVKVESAIKTKVAELGTRFDGRRPTDPESFGQMFDAAGGEIIQSVPESMRGRVGAEIAARRDMAVAEIAGRAQKYELDRAISTTRVGLKSDTEEGGVYARDGRMDLAEVVRGRAASRVERMVADGVWSAEEGQIHLQEVYGDIEAERIFGEAARGGGLESAYRDALTGGESVAGLSLTQRDRLVSRLSAEMGRRESAAAHARAQHAAAVRSNSDLASAVTEHLRSGYEPVGPLGEVYKALRDGRMEVTPEARDAFNRASGTLHISAAVLERPPSQADEFAREAQGAAAAGALDPSVAGDVTKVVDSHRAGITGSDPIGYLAGKGLLRHGQTGPVAEGAANAYDPGPRVPPPPVQFGDANAFAASLAERVQRVGVAEAKYERTLPSLTKSEASQLKEWLDQAGPKDRVAILGILAGTEGGERSKRTLKLLADSGGNNYALVGALAAKGMTAEAELVAQADFIDVKDRRALLKPEGSASTLDSDFNAEAGDLFSYNPTDRKLLKQAAIAIYTSESFPSTEYDAEKFREAVRKATGGRLASVELGGYWGTRKTSILAPLDDNGNPVDVQDVIDRLDGAMIDSVGGTNLVGGSEAAAELIRENATRFVPVPGRDGAFTVFVQRTGQPQEEQIPAADGVSPLVLDFKALGRPTVPWRPPAHF